MKHYKAFFDPRYNMKNDHASINAEDREEAFQRAAKLCEYKSNTKFSFTNIQIWEIIK